MLVPEGNAVAVIGHIAFWVLINYVLISFVEHIIHRYLMHMRRLPHLVYRLSPYLLDVFEAHAVRHHLQWYKTFNYEPEPVGREENLDIRLVDTAAILTGSAPIWLLEMWLWPTAGFLYMVMMFIHNRLWSSLHRQMHIPQGVLFKDWPVFTFLARYHFMHHQMVGKNFNLVFPLADLFMGCVAKPRLRDIRKMVGIGLLCPRRKRTIYSSEPAVPVNVS